MTIDRTELMITTDLTALAADSRRELPSIAETMPGAGVYRDDRASAAAKRDAVADERRRELAVMPLALAHTFAHRIGRAAAGGTAIAGAVLISVLFAEAWITRFAAQVIPGLSLPLIVALLAGAVVLAYALGTAIAEAVFARRMERAIATSSDPHADLESLAIGPVAAGRELVRRADRWSIALALGGLVAAVPLVSYLVFALGMSRSPAAMMMSVTALTTAEVHATLDAMGVAIALGLTLAALIAHACDREHRRAALPRWVERVGHWSMLPIAFVLGLVVLLASVRATFDHRSSGSMPSFAWMTLLAIGSVASTLLPAAWGLLWWRRREHARLGM